MLSNGASADIRLRLPQEDAPVDGAHALQGEQVQVLGPFLELLQSSLETQKLAPVHPVNDAGPLVMPLQLRMLELPCSGAERGHRASDALHVAALERDDDARELRLRGPVHAYERRTLRVQELDLARNGLGEILRVGTIRKVSLGRKSDRQRLGVLRLESEGLRASEQGTREVGVEAIRRRPRQMREDVAAQQVMVRRKRAVRSLEDLSDALHRHEARSDAHVPPGLGQDFAEAVLTPKRHGLRQMLGEPVIGVRALAERKAQEQVTPQTRVSVSRELQRSERSPEEGCSVGVGTHVRGRQRRAPREVDRLSHVTERKRGEQMVNELRPGQPVAHRVTALECFRGAKMEARGPARGQVLEKDASNEIVSEDEMPGSTAG